MDKYSFLNAAHSQLIADLYDQYLKYPDSVEPSWKAFFQGFDFARENYGENFFDEETTHPQAEAPAKAQQVQQMAQAVQSGEVPEDILSLIHI